MESSLLSTRLTTSDIDLECSFMESFDYIFYWNASNDPLNPSVEKNWKLYDKSDQKKLNEDYEKYLKNKDRNICDLGSYNVDFDKFLQINKIDESKIRPVKKFSSDINKELEKFEEEYNNYVAEIYPKLSEIFDGKIEKHHEMKFTYRKKIASVKEDQKIKLNIAYDYLSDATRRQNYDSKDIKKLTKVPFDNNLLILKNEKELLERILEDNTKLDFDVNFKGKNEMSLLYMAARCGYKNIVAMLLDSGSLASELQGNGSTALHAAAFYGHKDIVKLLLEVGVDADIKNNFGNLAEEEAYSDEIIKLIQDFKENDKSYGFFKENYNQFKKVKLVFNQNGFIGKRALLKGRNTRNMYWDLAWHGTRLQSIPSIIRHGLKKPGDKVEGKEITLREDRGRIERNITIREKENWATAIFTSHSIFYSATGAYAENFEDHDGKTWILILECRLKKNSYYQSKHTFHRYDLRKNEPDLVENRTENPDCVEVYAVWQFKKEFLDKQKDYDVLKEFLIKYISD